MLALALLGGCGVGEAPPRVALDEQDAEAMRTWLLPRFELAVAPRLVPSEPVATELEAARERLGELAEEELDYTVWLTEDPNVDAGCLPGGLLWLSEGLLALAQDRDEVLGALVFASGLCPAASGLWRDRENTRLVDDRDGHALYTRYRDFRLVANAPLYNLMVAAGCDRDCSARIEARILAVDGDPASWRRLLARVRTLAPDAALLLRIDAEQIASPEIADANAEGDDWLAPFHQRREALLLLADSRRSLWAGDLLPAYRSGLRARNQLPDSLRLQMHQAALDLANRHTEYAQRILNQLQERGEAVPHAGYWWGWIHVNLRRREQAAASFEQSIEQLPRASAHYRLGDALLRLHRHDEARKHYTTALEAGELHADYIRARARLEDLAES